MMVRALVVDAHPIVRKAVKEVLKTAFPFIDIKDSSGGGDVLQEVCGHPWAFVVLDIHLPGQNGINIIKKAKASCPMTPIVVFSTYSESQYAARALRAGALAYLSKDRSPQDFVDTVRKALLGRTVKKPRESVLSQPTLSDREVEVLSLLIKGMSRKHISKQLRIKERTVSTYKARILQKLDLENLADLIRYAVEEGLFDR